MEKQVRPWLLGNFGKRMLLSSEVSLGIAIVVLLSVLIWNFVVLPPIVLSFMGVLAIAGMLISVVSLSKGDYIGVITLILCFLGLCAAYWSYAVYYQTINESIQRINELNAELLHLQTGWN